MIGTRGNGLEVDLFRKQRIVEMRNRNRDTQDQQQWGWEQPPRRTFNYRQPRGEPYQPQIDPPNLNDRDGNPQVMVNHIRANVQKGECYKCGKAAFHNMYSTNCTKRKKPLAAEPCKKCKHGLHYEEDCSYQFEQESHDENRGDKTRRIKRNALETYYDILGYN